MNLRIVTKNHASDPEIGFLDLKVQWLRNSHADSVGVKSFLTA